ncbi:MAG: hypothetical protein DSY80_04095 [Desulfocapsa sp.]|nr:MAG: hypothetical protein DSY80_04095 [Desulfocapsa sp.]
MACCICSILAFSSSRVSATAGKETIIIADANMVETANSLILFHFCCIIISISLPEKYLSHNEIVPTKKYLITIGIQLCIKYMLHSLRIQAISTGQVAM